MEVCYGAQECKQLHERKRCLDPNSDYGNAQLMEKREAYTGTNNTERNAISKNIDGPGELEIHDQKRAGDSLHLLGKHSSLVQRTISLHSCSFYF